MTKLKYAVEYFLAFLLWLISKANAIADHILLWWELRDNHGSVAIMLFYAPELKEHQAVERLFGNVQGSFDAGCNARFMRFAYKYNQQLCQRLQIQRTDVPVVVCEWSRLVRAIGQTTKFTGRPIAVNDEKLLEQQIREFMGFSAELARRRPS